MAGAGYEDQPVADDPTTVADSERLRAAFAALLSERTARPFNQPYTMEDIWAQQGQSQLPRPVATQQWDLPLGAEADRAPMPQQSMNPPGMRFPTAPPGPDSPMRSQKPPANMPRLPDEPPPRKRGDDIADAFPGAKSISIKPYELPKKNKKKGKG